jgi:hypothetical protein
MELLEQRILLSEQAVAVNEKALADLNTKLRSLKRLQRRRMYDRFKSALNAVLNKNSRMEVTLEVSDRKLEFLGRLADTQDRPNSLFTLYLPDYRSSLTSLEEQLGPIYKAIEEQDYSEYYFQLSYYTTSTQSEYEFLRLEIIGAMATVLRLQYQYLMSGWYEWLVQGTELQKETQIRIKALNIQIRETTYHIHQWKRDLMTQKMLTHTLKINVILLNGAHKLTPKIGPYRRTKLSIDSISPSGKTIYVTCYAASDDSEVVYKVKTTQFNLILNDLLLAKEKGEITLEYIPK